MVKTPENPGGNSWKWFHQHRQAAVMAPAVAPRSVSPAVPLPRLASLIGEASYEETISMYVSLIGELVLVYTIDL